MLDLLVVEGKSAVVLIVCGWNVVVLTALALKFFADFVTLLPSACDLMVAVLSHFDVDYIGVMMTGQHLGLLQH